MGNQTDQDLSTAIYTNSTAIGNDAIINASNQMVLGSSSVTSVKTSGAMNELNYLVNGTNINTIYQPISSMGNYYLKSDVDTTFTNYYTNSQVDTSLTNYYTKSQTDTTFTNYYTKSQV